MTAEQPPRWHANASVKDTQRTIMVERHHLDRKITLAELLDYVRQHVGGDASPDQIMVNASLTWERPVTEDEAEYFAEVDRRHDERKRLYHRRMVRIFEDEYGPDRAAWPRATDHEWETYQRDRERMLGRRE